MSHLLTPEEQAQLIFLLGTLPPVNLLVTHPSPDRRDHYARLKAFYSALGSSMADFYKGVGVRSSDHLHPEFREGVELAAAVYRQFYEVLHYGWPIIKELIPQYCPPPIPKTPYEYLRFTVRDECLQQLYEAWPQFNPVKNPYRTFSPRGEYNALRDEDKLQSIIDTKESGASISKGGQMRLDKAAREILGETNASLRQGQFADWRLLAIILLDLRKDLSNAPLRGALERYELANDAYRKHALRICHPSKKRKGYRWDDDGNKLPAK